LNDTFTFHHTLAARLLCIVDEVLVIRPKNENGMLCEICDAWAK